MADDIGVELALQGPPPQRFQLRIAPGTTAAQLLRAQGLRWPDPDALVSIWGFALDGGVCPDPERCLLRDGDRIEVSPRLRLTPMQLRRARAEAQAKRRERNKGGPASS